MSWVGVGVAAVGAIKGGMDAKAAGKRQTRLDDFRRASIQYSPWSGMGDPGAQSAGNSDVFSGMLGGGAQGYALGSGIGGAFGGGGAAAASGGMGASGTNALGSGAMNAELGQMGTNMGQMQAQVGGQGGMYKSLANSSAGAMGSASQMQMPQLGSGMKSMYGQMKGMDPYSKTFGLGMDYGR